jgi:glycosyltransferase involved in cell wall biosynthesis
MIIGIDASRYGHKEATGVEFYSFNIINELAKISKKDADAKLRLYLRNKPEDKRFEALKQFIHIELKHLKAPRLWTIFALSKEMLLRSPDVLFVPSHILPPFLPKKSIITIHDVAFKRYKDIYSTFSYHHLNFSTKLAVKRATKIITPSQATAEDLKYYFNCDPKKIEIIPHGYDAKKINLKTKDNKEKFFFFLGRIETKKNLINLIRAFKFFIEESPQYKLILAGKDGLGAKTIKEEVQKLKLTKNVVFTGYISEEEKAFYYKNASAFVFTTLFEGFGLPVLEAFNYNVPVICSNDSALAEIAKDGALLVNKNSPEEIFQAMKKITSDKNLQEKLIKCGNQILKNHSWTQAAEKTYQLIKSV